MENKRNNSMLEGSLWDKILLFALPLAASSILQQLFNASDVAIVGQFAGSNPLAAVGANSSIINLLINSFVGLSVGTNVVIASYIGQGKQKHTRRAVHTSLVLALTIGIILLFVGMIFARQALELISTPNNILEMAVLYLRIYLIGAPFIMLYNFEAAILRSRGETKFPLIILAISGVVNVLLNVFFVVDLRMSVAGVAIATVSSNVMSAICLFIYLLKDPSITHVDLKELSIDRKILIQIAKIGIPAALQGAVFSISNVVIQNAINKFGSDAIAGSATALNFEYFSYYLLAAFGQASVTFIGQNYGAMKLERCRKVARICLLEGSIATVALSAFFLIFAKPLASIFTSNPKVLEIAHIRMVWLLSFEILNVGIECFSGIMRGYGNSMVPALITVFGVCGIRLLWIFTGAASLGTFDALMMSYPISWFVTVCALIVAYFIQMKRMS